MQSVEIVASRRKSLVWLAISLAFVVGIVLTTKARDAGNPIPWLSGGFFGLGALAAIRVLVRPMRLRLDLAGFTLTGAFIRKPRITAWEGIETFAVYRLPRGGAMVGWRLRRGTERSRGNDMASRLTGFDGALPMGWPGSPEMLAARMNACRAAAARAPGER